MNSFFDAQHWERVKQARAALGINRIAPESLLRPNHRLLHATLRHRTTDEVWTVTAVREDWLLGRYLAAELECNGRKQTCVVALLGCQSPEIDQKFEDFCTDFEKIVMH